MNKVLSKHSSAQFFAVQHRLCFALLFFVFVSLAAPDADAHTMRPAVATLKLAQSGTMDVSIKVNAEALLVGLGPEHVDTDDSPDAAAYNELRALSSAQLAQAFESFAEDFLRALVIESDVGVIQLVFNRIDVPESGDIDLSRDSVIELTGKVMSEAQYIIWRWPERYGSSIVRMGSSDSEAMVTAWLQAGQQSEQLRLAGMLDPYSAATIVKDYIVLGFKHILPRGLDHILFVLGLFLLSTLLRPLLWQVSAFTLAHTLTLGLSIYGVISLPSSIVEPLIALSIAYVGIENCLSSDLKPWRVALVFAFGLLHGLGFAGVLGDIGLPEGELFAALISFNIGVELGQLAIISLAWFAVGYFRQRDWYRYVIVLPGSLAIAFAGLFWTWQRVLA